MVRRENREWKNYVLEKKRRQVVMEIESEVKKKEVYCGKKKYEVKKKTVANASCGQYIPVR